MPKGATIHARVDKRLKQRAEKVLHQIGMSTSDLITLLLHQVVLTKGVPFDVKIPNQETIDAIEELERGGGERFKGTAEELSRHLLRPRRRA